MAFCKQEKKSKKHFYLLKKKEAANIAESVSFAGYTSKQKTNTVQLKPYSRNSNWHNKWENKRSNFIIFSFCGHCLLLVSRRSKPAIYIRLPYLGVGWLDPSLSWYYGIVVDTLSHSPFANGPSSYSYILWRFLVKKKMPSVISLHLLL